MATQYQYIMMHSANLTTYPLSREIALEAAELRATLNLRTPDAIQVATARVSGADTFITNDVRLRVPEGITRLILNELLQSQEAEKDKEP